jgi:hypothetical protein
MELRVGDRVLGDCGEGYKYTGTVFSVYNQEATIKRDDRVCGGGDIIPNYPSDHQREKGYLIKKRSDGTWGSDCNMGNLTIQEGLIMNFNQNAVEAEFELVNAKEEEKAQIRNLPARLDDVKILRHPKALADPEYLKAFKEDMNLDIELGLNNQFEMDQKKVLQKDIDELTKSNEYYQVTRGLLAKIFNIRRLRSMCASANIKEAVVQSFVALKVPLLLFALLIGSIMGSFWMGHIEHHYTGLTGQFFDIGIALTVIWELAVAVGIIACFCSNFGNVRFNYEFMKVDVDLEEAKATRVPIPRMAKLKMKEAKDTGLFEGFTIAYPQFRTSKKSFKPDFGPFFRALGGGGDPVILGVTKDSRMFMICWWDIAKDIDRVKTHIKMFKKFKIE